MTPKNYRHGNICLLGIEKLPEGLIPSKTQILIQQGSGGNPHTFKGGVFYPKKEGDFLLGYLEAKKTKLYHVEHSPEGAAIEDRIYEVRFQVEATHEGMKQVID